MVRDVISVSVSSQKDPLQQWLAVKGFALEMLLFVVRKDRLLL